MAKDVDPRRERTLGVLTKPDLVDIDAEDTVCQLTSMEMQANLSRF